jgi:hypothetical protein
LCLSLFLSPDAKASSTRTDIPKVSAPVTRTTAKNVAVIFVVFNGTT